MKLTTFVLSLAAAASFLIAVPAFAETPPATTTTTPATTTPTAQPVPDAAALRDDLLVVAFANLNQIAGSSFQGFFPAWSSKYPGLKGNGYAIVSTPGNVSIWWNRLDPKGAATDKNPEAIAFAVADSQGRCAGGVLFGNPKIDKTAKVTVTGTCTAQSVVDQFMQTLNAPTTAPATATEAPKPPATGNAIATNDRAPLGSIAIVVLACGLAATFAMRRRARI
ncbi:MAG: hypothetical protein ABI577_06790 [bacterium]